MSYTFVLSGRESVLSTKIYPPIILNENEQYVLGLIDFMSYNTIPNVDQTNNKFHIDGYDITIPEGSYEVEDLSNYLTEKITELELKLDRTPEKDETDIDKNTKGEKQNLVTQGGNAKARKQHNMDQPTSLIMRINNNTLKCEIKSNKVIHFEKPNTIAPLLGFTSKRLSPLKTHVAENPVHITKVNSICVECNLITNSYVNENQGHIIHMFYPNVLPGYKIVEIPKKVIYLPVTNRYIDEIFIKIVDQDDRVLVDNSIVSREMHSHLPYANATFNHCDEIRLPIQTQDIYTQPSESYLYIEGRLTNDGKESNTLHFVNNGLMHLFDEIRYEIGGCVIDRVRNVGHDHLTAKCRDSGNTLGFSKCLPMSQRMVVREFCAKGTFNKRPFQKRNLAEQVDDNHDTPSTSSDLSSTPSCKSVKQGLELAIMSVLKNDNDPKMTFNKRSRVTRKFAESLTDLEVRERLAKKKHENKTKQKKRKQVQRKQEHKQKERREMFLACQRVLLAFV
ncbi:unnamed protein product [Diabrotica balteata]|uniref:Uncharacterized protein n=1 Tax=Diabrotica balteata TaxID=107213 RepID=A0A9P0DVP2_DIABA|nr:unnamed protein product [Diabrotica balteata]